MAFSVCGRNVGKSSAEYSGAGYWKHIFLILNTTNVGIKRKIMICI